METVLFTLQPSDYWQWRFKLQEIELQTIKKRLAHRTLEGMDKDLEILRLKTLAFKASIGQQESLLDRAKLEYEEFKKSLETQYGHSMESCVIDDITLEVKRIE